MASRIALASLVLLLGLMSCDSARSDLDPLSPEFIDLSTLSQDPDDLVGTWDLAATVYFESVDGVK